MTNNDQPNKVNINWFPGHMAKTRRQITEDLKLVDVVVEILDARIPISSQNPDIRQITKNKKKIIVLNKEDLADEKENQKWVEYFLKRGEKAVLVNSNDGRGINNVIKQIQIIMQDELESNANKGRIGRKIRVMVVGIPNVGKSSFINRITKRTLANVGNKPGVTKQKQWIRVNQNIELLDTPGVLWPKLDQEKIALHLSYTGTIKDEILPTIDIGYQFIQRLKNDYLEQFMARYRIEKERFDQIEKSDLEEAEKVIELMNEVGKKRGAIVSGGEVDLEKVANLVLDDFRKGKLGRITLEQPNQ